MARRRQPVQTLQEAVRFTPQAEPVTGADVTVARPDTPVYDFTPISRLLTESAAADARADAEKKVQAGEAFAVKNPQLVADIEADLADIKDAKERGEKSKEAFAFLQRSGQIVAPADPWWQVGYARAAGRQLAASYADRLQGRLAEVSALRDPKTGDLTSPPDVDAIIAEEWERVGNSPAVQNFYGGQEAIATKSQADAEFRATVSKRRSAQAEEDYQGVLTREIGGKFDQLLSENPVVTSETLQPLTDYLTTEVRGHNVLNPRELTMQALELSIQRLAAVDSDEAVRAVYAAQDLVVGGVRMGEDRGPVGLRLQDLTRRVGEQATDQLRKDNELTSAKRLAAIHTGEDEYVSLLTQAKNDGQSVPEIAKRLATKYLAEDDAAGRFHGLAPFVVNAMNEFATHLDAARSSDATVLDQFNVYVADGRLDAAEALVRASIGAQSITGADYAAALASLEQRRSVSAEVEQSPLYRAFQGQYDQARPTGFEPAVQERINTDFVARKQDAERDFVAYVKTTVGEPNREDLHRAWQAERASTDLGEIRKAGTETRTRNESTVAEIRQKLARYQDAGDLIDRALQSGTFTIAEAQQYRESRDEAVARRESFFSTTAYKEAQSLLDAEFDRLEGGDAPTPEDLAARSAAHDEMRDRFSVALDSMLADPSASPATFEARARSEVRRVEREVHQELFPSDEAKAAEVGLEAGKSAPVALESARKLVVDRETSGRWRSLIATPQARESMTGAMFAQVAEIAKPTERAGGSLAQNQNSFYDYAAAWMSGRDPILGSPVQREDVEDYAREILRAGPSPEATASVLSVVGVSPQDYLAGKTTLQPRAKAEIERQITRLGHMGGLGFDSGERQRQIQSLEDLRQPLEVSLDGIELSPFTTPFFRSRGAFEAYRSDPSYPDFLRRLSIDPESETDVADWEHAQLDNIDRTNP